VVALDDGAAVEQKTTPLFCDEEVENAALWRLSEKHLF
jgi:hypothetical protein